MQGMCTSINPTTGEVLCQFEQLTDAQLEVKIRHAAVAFHSYRRTPIQERARLLLQVAGILECEKEVFARLMTNEMGKTFSSAVAETEKCAWVCRYYAENGERFLADEMVNTGTAHSYVRYQPLGTLLAVMPWNFPFWQVLRFAAPALMAGNVGLLKHAPNVPQCALALEDLFLRAGFPEGVFQTLLISVEQVERVIADTRVAAITLTGSETAGRAVASAAGKQVKKTVLELGGSDPFIITPSADLDMAVQMGVKARLVNNGQSCLAAKRFIVVEIVADAFEQRFVASMNALRVGDPLDPTTDVGPLATAGVLDVLDHQVQRAVAHGAHVLTGGQRLARSGYYYTPTVLANVSHDSPVYYEEFFGPVALLFRVRSLDEAIDLANDSPFGLSSSAWTNDPTECARLIDEIEAGAVFINTISVSDPRMPFGGVKRSGYGRELSIFGIREFVNVKAVTIADDASGSR